jgi:hypothetical protein
MKTSRKQILQSGVEKSMSSPEVFPASLFLAPDSERERKMTATSGRKCYERYGRFSPIGLLVKTLLESSQWYNPAVKLRWDVKNLCSERLTEKEYCIGRNTLSKQCVTTLNVKDISSNRLLFRLVPSERRTEETVSSLLPTVQTQGLKVCNENGKTTFYPVGLLPTPRAVEVVEHPMKAAARTKDRTGTKLNNLSSGAAFGLLPTPMASDATTGAIIGKNDQFVTTRNGTPRRINQNGQNGSVGLARMVRLLPTPNAREADKYSKKYNPNSQMGTALTAMAVNGMLPYSSSEGLSTLRFPTSIEKKKWENEDGCSVQPAGNVRRASFAERWKNFPTQSPVCSRDDGISTRLDGIAFSKWRQESIKAYGNAIVPQVMYEIFQAIQETYNQ